MEPDKLDAMLERWTKAANNPEVGGVYLNAEEIREMVDTIKEMQGLIAGPSGLERLGHRVYDLEHSHHYNVEEIKRLRGELQKAFDEIGRLTMRLLKARIQ